MGNLRKKWSVFWRVFYENDGYRQVLTGIRNTMLIAVCGLFIGIVIGTVIAIIEVIPKRGGILRLLEKLCHIYVAFFRGTPIVVQLLLGYFVILPLLNIRLTSVAVCMIIFGMNSGAYVSEIMRSGIQSVDPGQMEAGRALGNSFASTMWSIVIPQAIRNILPTIGNEFISLVKETSVVSFVGATDIYTAFRYIGAGTYEYMVPYLVMAVIYIGIVLLITLGIRIMERRLRHSERK